MKGTRMVALEMFDPFMKPTWRWDVAGQIARGEAVDYGDDDPLVRAAVAFRTRLEGCQAASTNRRRGSKQPTALEAAYGIFQEDGLCRAKIEAYLLTGISYAEVSARCGVPAAVVRTYARIFFDVQDHLRASDWIAVHVIGPGPHVGFKENELRGFWAWSGFGGGTQVLDELVGTFRSLRRHSDPVSLRVYLEPEAPLRLSAFVARAVIPQGAMPPDLQFDLHADVLASDATTDSVAAEAILDRARRKTVVYGRAILDGKPLPSLRPRGRRCPSTTRAKQLPTRRGERRSKAANLQPAGMGDWLNAQTGLRFMELHMQLGRGKSMLSLPEKQSGKTDAKRTTLQLRKDGFVGQKQAGVAQTARALPRKVEPRSTSSKTQVP